MPDKMWTWIGYGGAIVAALVALVIAVESFSPTPKVELTVQPATETQPAAAASASDATVPSDAQPSDTEPDNTVVSPNSGANSGDAGSSENNSSASESASPYDYDSSGIAGAPPPSGQGAPPPMPMPDVAPSEAPTRGGDIDPCTVGGAQRGDCPPPAQ